MSAGPASLAVFDLDGTLSFRDTFAAFVAGYLRRHPARLIGTPGAALALAAWCVGVLDRGQLKSRLIRAFMGGDSRQDIEHWSRAFSSQLVDHGMRPEALEALQAHRQRGDCLILLSASPDLYVPEIGRLLGMHRVICTRIRFEGDRLQGGLLTLNRRGREKLRCLEALREEFPDASISAYGNAASDLAHLAAADHPMLVNGRLCARRRAVRIGIRVGDWN